MQTAHGPAPADVELRTFFERSFLPHRKPGQGGRTYSEAITWLERAIRRPAMLADLTSTNLARLERYVARCGFGPVRARELTKKLRGLARYAERLGFVVPTRDGARTAAPAPARRPAFLARRPGPKTLRAGLEGLLANLAERGESRSSLNAHTAAVHQFDRYLARYATPRDVTPRRLANFRAALEAEGRRTVARQYAEKLRRIARALLGREVDGRKKLPPPPAPAGSVRAFFQETYRPERMVRGRNLRDFQSTLRLLHKFRGDVALVELSDALAADFFTWLLEVRGVRAVTVNAHRSRLFAIWRLAVERGLLSRDPRVRKLRAASDAPDAWTLEEMRRIIDAPLNLAWPGPIAGIPRGPYYQALLLLALYTALRKGSLFELPRSAVDLSTGWVEVSGTIIKNGRGKRFRVGADAIAAVQAIWRPERELLFPFPFSDGVLHRDIRRILAAAGVSPSTRKSMTQLHKVRRTTATALTVQRDIAAAAELLGHSNTEVTRRYVDTSKLPGCDMTALLGPAESPAPAMVDQACPVGNGEGTRLDPRAVLRDAARLLAGGDVTFAAWGARAALERWLCDVGQACGCTPAKGEPRGVTARARKLLDAGRLSAGEFHNIRKINKAANRPAHGHQVAAAKVEAMLATVATIVNRSVDPV